MDLASSGWSSGKGPELILSSPFSVDHRIIAPEVLLMLDGSPEDVAFGSVELKRKKDDWKTRWCVVHGRYLSIFRTEPRTKDDFDINMETSVDLHGEIKASLQGSDLFVVATNPLSISKDFRKKRWSLSNAFHKRSEPGSLVFHFVDEETATKWLFAMIDHGLDQNLVKDANPMGLTVDIGKGSGRSSAPGLQDGIFEYDWKLRVSTIRILSVSKSGKTNLLLEVTEPYSFETNPVPIGNIILDQCYLEAEISSRGQVFAHVKSEPFKRYRSKYLRKPCVIVIPLESLAGRNLVVTIKTKPVSQPFRYFVPKQLLENGYVLSAADVLTHTMILVVFIVTAGSLGAVFGILVTAACYVSIILTDRHMAFIAAVEIVQSQNELEQASEPGYHGGSEITAARNDNYADDGYTRQTSSSIDKELPVSTNSEPAE